MSEINVTIESPPPINIQFPGTVGTGGGDMVKAIYDPTNVEADAFSMGNFSEAPNALILTQAERDKLAGLDPGTDLSLGVITNTSLEILSSTGAGVVLPIASNPSAGLMSGDDFIKLRDIEPLAEVNPTAAEIKILYESNPDTNPFTDADKTKLDGITPGAEPNDDAATIKIKYESNADTNAFTDADLAKLAGIETGAQVNPTGAEIKVLYEGNADTNAFTDADLAKLNSIEFGAEVNQTDTEIRDQYFNAVPLATVAEMEAGTVTQTRRMSPSLINDAIQALAPAGGGDMLKSTYDPTNISGDAFLMSNMVETTTDKIFTNSERVKLQGIESGAQVNPDSATIKVLYESNPNTNAFTDSEQVKLAGIEPGAEVNPTDNEIVASYNAIVPKATTPEMIAGTVTDDRRMSPALVKDAIDGQINPSLYMLVSTYDPGGVNADAFSMGNMVETANELIFTSVERAKLTGIESGAEVNPTAPEIASLYESNPNTNKYTDAEQSKLAAIEAGAQNNQGQNLGSGNDAEVFFTKVSSTLQFRGIVAGAGMNITQTSDQITFESTASGTGDMEKTVYDPNLVEGDAFSMGNFTETPTEKIFTDAERTKLAGLTAGADMSKSVYDPTLVEGDAFDMDNMSEGVTNLILTGAERSKLAGIEAGAEVNPTASEIKTLYESNPDTNEFSDAEKSKLAGIESGAQVNTVLDVFGLTGNVDINSLAETTNPDSSGVIVVETSPGVFEKVKLENLASYGGGSVFLFGKWTLDAFNFAPPAPGTWRTDTGATVVNTNTIWVHDTNSDGLDKGSELSLLNIGDQLAFQQSNNKNNRVIFTINDIVDNGTYYEFGVDTSKTEIIGTITAGVPFLFYGIFSADSGGGGTALGAPWRFETNTDTSVDPGNRDFRLNNADMSLVTEMSISATTNEGNDAGAFIKLLQPGNRIYCQNENDSTRFVTLQLTENPIDNGNWFRLQNLTVVDSGTIIGNNRAVTGILFIYSPISGEGGDALETVHVTDADSPVSVEFFKLYEFDDSAGNVVFNLPVAGSGDVDKFVQFHKKFDGSESDFDGIINTQGGQTIGGATSFNIPVRDTNLVLRVVDDGSGPRWLQQFLDNPFKAEVVPFSNPLTFDLNLGNAKQVTLTGDTVINRPNDLKEGILYMFRFVQDGVGTHAATFDDVFQFSVNNPVFWTQRAGAVDVVFGVFDGVTINCSFLKDISRDETAGTDLGEYVLWWKFNEPPNAVEALDSSFFAGANGEISGGVTTGLPGAIKNSYDFDGSNDTYVSTENVDVENAMSGRDVFSINFWARKPALPGKNFECAFGMGDMGTNDCIAIYPFLADGNTEVFYNNTEIITAPSPFAPDNNWHMYTFVSRSATDQEYYIDGVSVGTSVLNNSLDNNLDYVNAGSYDTNEEYYIGGIDDVRVTRAALTVQEIQNLFALGTP